MQLIFDTSVLAALELLQPPDQQRVRQKLEELTRARGSLKQQAEVRPDLRMMAFGGTLYELSIPPDFRALLRASEDRISVMALVRKSFVSRQ
jgi:hypothetical protein